MERCCPLSCYYYWTLLGQGKIDTRAGLGKKKSRELKKIIVDAIVEGHRQAHKKD